MNNLKLSYLPLFKDINKDDLSSLLKCLNVKEKTMIKIRLSLLKDHILIV